ncbi:MAG: dTDP-4-amino-4,6-dideoxygalactose transaminase [Acidobacteriota bacterium]
MIPFNRPCLVGKEFEYMRAALEQGHLSGNGPFTKRCSRWLESNTGCVKALMTHSCTAALEMAALLLDCGPGDEVIMPSFAFVSTANAFVLRGATPVFVDVRPETMTIDPALVERAVTPRTKAIVALHYAGVACDMDALSDIAARYAIAIVEDAAQAIFASYRGKPLGSIGTFGALSFHETKNVISGEGGALLINDPRHVERAEILWEKGTNRNQFFRGAVDKYTWVDLGSSFLPSELICAFLQAQLESAQQLTSIRLGLWRTYHRAFEDLEAAGRIRRPIVPDACGHNAHMYYLLTGDGVVRANVLAALNEAGIGAVFHYVPLHSSPAGRRYGRAVGPFAVTDDVAARLIRLPLWPDLSVQQMDTVIGGVHRALARARHA